MNWDYVIYKKTWYAQYYPWGTGPSPGSHITLRAGSKKFPRVPSFIEREKEASRPISFPILVVTVI